MTPIEYTPKRNEGKLNKGKKIFIWCIVGFMLFTIIYGVTIKCDERIDKVIQDTKDQYEIDNPDCIFICFNLINKSIVSYQDCNGILEFTGNSTCSMLRGNIEW
jgi:hypothetical protein